MPYSANDMVERTHQGPELDRVGHNRVFRIGNSRSGIVAAAIASREPFPLRTLIVCFTIWLIATQAMIFDELKFHARAHLLEQSARSFGAPQVVVPNERAVHPGNQSKGAKIMNSTNPKRMNLPIRELLRAESCGEVMKFRVRWQTAVETVSGHGLQKLRLELAHSVSELLLTSTHGNDDNDRSINIVRPSHLPVSV